MLANEAGMRPETPLRELHEQQGARMGVRLGTMLPESYGDYAAEYRAARETAALIDTNYQLFAFLEGPDRARYLNAVVSNNVKDLEAGQGTLALLLNPQGHILSELACYVLPERSLIASHAAARERTIATLDKFIIMDDATLSDVTEKFGALAIEGPAAGTVLAELCGVKLESLAERQHVETEVASIPCRAIRRTHTGSLGTELIAPRSSLAELWQILAEAAKAHGGRPIGYAAVNALRLEAGIPWFGADFGDDVIPNEAALETTHLSFTKGCYTGQEIVERVRSRGHVNKRRVGLEFSGTGVPEAGSKLTAEGKEAGYVTSAAQLPLSQRTIGMGYARREHNTPGSWLQWGQGSAKIIELSLTPFAEAG